MKVTQIFPEKGSLAGILPQYLSLWTTNKIRELGIEIVPEVDIDAAALSSNGKQIELTLSNGRKVQIFCHHLIFYNGKSKSRDVSDQGPLRRRVKCYTSLGS